MHEIRVFEISSWSLRSEVPHVACDGHVCSKLCIRRSSPLSAQAVLTFSGCVACEMFLLLGGCEKENVKTIIVTLEWHARTDLRLHMSIRQDGGSVRKVG